MDKRYEQVLHRRRKANKANDSMFAVAHNKRISHLKYTEMPFLIFEVGKTPNV